MNIFKNIPSKLKDELFEDILTDKNFKIERIVSYGHASKDYFWYDQDKNEWLIVLQGEAKIMFEDKSEISLKKGDTLNIKAHQKHKVTYTSKDEKTIWLAVHY